MLQTLQITPATEVNLPNLPNLLIPLHKDTFKLLMSFLDLTDIIRITSTCKALYELNPMNEYFEIYTLSYGTQSLRLAEAFAWIYVILSKNTNQPLSDVISDEIRDVLRETLGHVILNNKASEILCLKGDESLPEEQRKGQLPVELNT
jgi:hypothetical protein